MSASPRPRRAAWLAAPLALVTASAACVGEPPPPITPGEPISVLEASLRYDYARALGASWRFYEAQRSGADQSPRVPWRGPATLADGGDVGLDLSGGWYDAGDHVKFGQPMAYSAAMLAWGVVDERATLAGAGELAPALDNLRFVADYFLAAYDRGASAAPDDDRLAFQVGDGNADHGYWGPPERMPASLARPTFVATRDARATEVVAGTAAALAAIAVAIRPDDAAYADTLVAAARDLYRFAEAFPGNEALQAVASPFYRSWSGWADELVWGAIWLHRATGEPAYLARARTALAAVTDLGAGWAHSWDNVIVGALILLHRADPQPAHRQPIDAHFTAWLPGGSVAYTAGGLAWLAQWGSLRYATTEAFLALAYARDVDDAGRATALREFAVRQVNYALGDNPRAASYVIGVGASPPRNPHHRAAHGSPDNNINNPTDNSHTLVGALVGGPETRDDLGWRDDRSNYLTAEVACDYNAGFTGALAAILTLAGDTYQPPAGGEPAPDEPTEPDAPDEPDEPGAPDEPAPDEPAPDEPGAVGVVVTAQSDWGAGYCVEVDVTNDSATTAVWAVEVPVEGTVRDAWNARWAQDGARVLARGVDWNAALAPGASTRWGFCADR